MSAVPKPQRVKDDQFREFVAQHPCVVSDSSCRYAEYLRGRRSDFCHLRSVGAGGGDEQGFPGCRYHHSEQHNIGPKSFERKYQLNLKQIADDLWATYQSEWREAA